MDELANGNPYEIRRVFGVTVCQARKTFGNPARGNFGTRSDCVAFHEEILSAIRWNTGVRSELFTASLCGNGRSGSSIGSMVLRCLGEKAVVGAGRNESQAPD